MAESRGMSPGDRYASLLATTVREDELFATPREFDEHEVQAHWFAGDFGREFHTTDGRRVAVVQLGVWNREAGPDFVEAAVSIDGGEAVRGAIELDMDARDWERHGHSVNPAYETVVLHAFTRWPATEFFTRTLSHRLVPQVRLDLAALGGDRPNPQPTARPGRCVAPLREVDEARLREMVLGAAEHRLKRKAAGLARIAELHGADEALFVGLAAALGYKSNKVPFTLLAQRLSLRLLRSAPEAADGILFGVAGFLPSHDLAQFPADARGYVRGLWEQWWPRRGDFERLRLPEAAWRLGGQRPANHPQRRLAALSQIVKHWPKVRALRQRCDPASITNFFAAMRDEFWDFHYTLTSRSAPRRMALVGESRVTEMLANVFFPLAWAEDSSRWLGFKNLPAALSNRAVKIAALRLFGADQTRACEILQTAAGQQGLLQIFEDFCRHDASDCAACPFPEQLTRW
jgi:hypothetical protein